jgi:hypothetical protein
MGKTMAKSETAWLDKYVLRWMSDVGGRIGTDRMGDAVSGAILGITRTKAAMDRNVESLLALANIPSRAEYQRMVTRVDVLQNRIVDLQRSLDAIMNDLGTARPKGRKKAPAKPAGGKAAGVKVRPRHRGSSGRKRT